MTEPAVEELPFIDLLQTPEHRADPHPLYHRLRRDEPALYVPEFDEFVLTRYGRSRSACAGTARSTSRAASPPRTSTSTGSGSSAASR